MNTPISEAADPRFAATYPGHNSSLESMVPRGVKTALDVGCGHGGMAAWLSQQNVLVDGVSWNADELESARKFCRRVMQCDASQGVKELENESYDLIICSHLLEHIAYPQVLLRDLHRALKPGGSLLIAIPNLLFWEDRLKLLMGRWKYEESGTFDYTHVRWYTVESMTDLLKEHGFKLECFQADGWVPLPGLRLILSGKRRASIDRAFCRWRPGLFGRQLLFRCTR